jgi:hypothetical protein
MKIALVTAGCLMQVAAANSQSKIPGETRNAALRYWMAFADMQDSPADKATQALLEKTAAGEAPWDEAKLGPILDKNEEAIRRMQRATKLPECDWGLEYSLGPRASVAYVSRARVLGRLNTLSGMRLVAKGDSSHAVNAWLAGIKFSQHLAQGGTLLSTLVAKSVLISNINAITQASRHGSLSPEEKAAALKTIQALPEAGMNWSAAWNFDASSTQQGIEEIFDSKDRKLAYENLFVEAMPPNVVFPGAEMKKEFREYMANVGEALRLPTEQSEIRIRELEQDRKKLDALLQSLVPSPIRINDSRKEVKAARVLAIQALRPN